MSWPKMFFWIVGSITDAAAVNPNSTKTVLANDLSTFSIKDKLIFSHAPRSLPRSLTAPFQTVVFWKILY